MYAGIATSEYRDLMMAGGDGLNYLGTASSTAVGGVAFKLGIMGPAIPVTLNCAASLVTVQQAVAGLRQGEVDLALVGGVNAVFSSGLTREMAALGMLSREGRCKTFDAGGRRLRAKRGLRDGGPEAAGRSGSRRRPHLGGDPGGRRSTRTG